MQCAGSDLKLVVTGVEGHLVIKDHCEFSDSHPIAHYFNQKTVGAAVVAVTGRHPHWEPVTNTKKRSFTSCISILGCKVCSSLAKARLC